MLFISFSSFFLNFLVGCPKLQEWNGYVDCPELNQNQSCVKREDPCLRGSTILSI
jgi:hypothetical protein